MRRAILSAHICRIVTGVWDNGADPKALPLYLADRIANGDAFPGEHIVRLPRRFSRVSYTAAAMMLGRGPFR
jgi:hypothetical protein